MNIFEIIRGIGGESGRIIREIAVYSNANLYSFYFAKVNFFHVRHTVKSKHTQPMLIVNNV